MIVDYSDDGELISVKARDEEETDEDTLERIRRGMEDVKAGRTRTARRVNRNASATASRRKEAL